MPASKRGKGGKGKGGQSKGQTRILVLAVNERFFEHRRDKPIKEL